MANRIVLYPAFVDDLEAVIDYVEQHTATSAAMTQAEAGAKVGMSRQAWNNLVKGRSPRMSVETLERIAKALGVAAAELLKTE